MRSWIAAGLFGYCSLLALGQMRNVPVNCTPGSAPQAPEPDAPDAIYYVEDLAAWWDACGGEGQHPPICVNGDEFKVIDRDGYCWMVRCTGATLTITACTALQPAKGFLISSIVFRRREMALVSLTDGKQTFARKLQPVMGRRALVQAMIGRKMLPTPEVGRMPSHFWQNLSQVEPGGRRK